MWALRSLTDTVTTGPLSKPISLKENTVPPTTTLRTELTGGRLFEMNYYWKRISLGIELPAGAGQLFLHAGRGHFRPGSSNSSFNVYLRYNLVGAEDWNRPCQELIATIGT